MMATTQPEDIPQTIRSRCQHFSFHAVSFDDIVGQLRDIAKQEGIKADDNALAMLAEAGDGSMRDALSIMDQAIASCGDTLSSDVVRGLVGTVRSDVLENVMDAVCRDSSDDVLRIVDRLLVEGQNAQHFARQMVRFLRNALVAKVSGAESPLLQISSDERARVSRVAERFSEEDLTRFLQIMLRTHSDLGYKHEQRFHLELGLLKLVHAQRLLPLEQLLSGEIGKPVSPAAASGARGGTGGGGQVSRSAGRPPHSQTAEAPTSRSSAVSPFSKPSPFEADRSRKTDPKAEFEDIGKPLPASADMFIPEATATPAEPERITLTAVAVAEEPTASDVVAELTPEILRDAVLVALEAAGQQMLAHNLESGEWSVRGNEVSAKVAMSQVMCDVALGDGPQRIVNGALSKAAGRPMKFKMVSGGAQFTPKPSSQAARPSNGVGAKSRAMADPLVKRMQEKFGAEIRSVIDQKDRG
jgi:DNA polymerase-3 subunit gamma/tau